MVLILTSNKYRCQNKYLNYIPCVHAKNELWIGSHPEALWTNNGPNNFNLFWISAIVISLCFKLMAVWITLVFTGRCAAANSSRISLTESKSFFPKILCTSQSHKPDNVPGISRTNRNDKLPSAIPSRTTSRYRKQPEAFMWSWFKFSAVSRVTAALRGGSLSRRRKIY